MSVPWKNVDAYLETVSPAARDALKALRSAILAFAPQAKEGFSYGMPAFLVNGKAIAGFFAYKNHL